MASINIDVRCDLNKPVTVRHLDGMVFSQDVKANRIRVSGFRDGEPVDLSGGSVSANIIRADGATVVQTGTISNNVCSVVLPSSAYAVPGPIAIFVKHSTSAGPTTSTIAAITGYVYKSTTDTIVDPGSVVPNVNQLLAMIEDCEEATEACIAATAAAPVIDDTAGSGDTNKVWSASKAAGENSERMAGIAPTYSSSATYAVGAYVHHNGHLYRCTTAIPSGEAWNSAHWTLAVIGTDMVALKNQMPVIDDTAGAGATTKVWSASKTTGALSELKNEIDDSCILSVNGFQKHNGQINSTGNWANVNTNYQHIIIPIKPNDSIYIYPNSTYNGQIGVLTAYSEPVQGVSASLSAVSGYTGRISVNKGDNPVSFNAPSDAVYLMVLLTNNTNNCIPRKLIINSYDYAIPFRNHFFDATKEIAENLATYYSGVGEILPNNKKQSWKAIPSSQGAWSQVGSDNYSFILISVNGGESYSIKAQTGLTCTWGVLTSFSEPVNGESVPFSSASGYTGRIIIAGGSENTGKLPSDARYVLVMLIDAGQNKSPEYCIIDDIDYTKSVYGNMRDLINRNVNWCSMGDSIAYGTRSYMDGDTPKERNDPQLSWAHAVSVKNHFNWTNIAIPGGGYLFASGERVPGYQLARNTDYTPYNLVTIAYGVNDWKGGSPLGTVADDPTVETPTTTLQAMKATIKAIMDSNPICKIIVISPLNCRGYDFSYGDFSTNYALGYVNNVNGKTLNEFVQGIRSVCEYYGIQFIDNAHEAFVNRLNIASALLDGVHPSMEAHAILGAEMARKITFK